METRRMRSSMATFLNASNRSIAQGELFLHVLLNNGLSQGLLPSGKKGSGPSVVGSCLSLVRGSLRAIDAQLGLASGAL